jgi:hypothetical protein
LGEAKNSMDEFFGIEEGSVLPLFSMPGAID